MADETKSYEEVAKRVIAAVNELNSALIEASAHPDVRVHLGPRETNDLPMQFGVEITKLTGHYMFPEDTDKTEFKWARLIKRSIPVNGEET